MSPTPDKWTLPSDAGSFAAALRPYVASFEHHAEIGSTNDDAKRLADADVKLPLLVLADRQTAGRGRGANKWWASKGALTFSLLLDPGPLGLRPANQGLLAIAAGVALVDAVRETCGLTAGLKWPNDVLLGSRKLAGVLVEAPRPDRWIVGVGANVENRFNDAPDSVRSRAATLADTSGATRGQVLVAYLRAFEFRREQAATSDYRLIDAIRTACVLKGRRVTVTDGSRRVTGKCRGINDQGELQIETERSLESLRAGSAEIVGKSS